MANILDQSQTDGTGNIATGGDCTFTSRFTPTHSGYIQKVEFELKAYTGNDTVATAELWSSNSGAMGSKIGEIGVRTLTDISSSYTWYEFTNSTEDCPVVASTEYFLTLATTAPSGYVHYEAKENGGEHYSLTAPPVTWGDHGWTCNFKQYYAEAETTTSTSLTTSTTSTSISTSTTSSSTSISTSTTSSSTSISTSTTSTSSSTSTTSTSISTTSSSTSTTTTLPVDRYWVGGTGDWSDDENHWATSSGGSPAIGNLPTSENNVFIDSSSGFGAGGTITLDSDSEIPLYDVCNDITCSSGHSFTIDGSYLRVYGSLTFESGITFSGEYISMRSTSVDETITTAGVSVIFSFENTGTWTLQDDLTMAGEFYQENGTFDANDHNVTANDFYFYADTGYTPTVVMGSGTWETTNPGSDYSWDIEELNEEVVTITPETSTIKINVTSNEADFVGAGKTYNNLTLNFIGWDSKYFEIYGSNIFNVFEVSGELGPFDLNGISFEDGTTTTVSTFNVSGEYFGTIHNYETNNAGTGYEINDELVVSGGNGDATILVEEVGVGGDVVTYSFAELTDYGTGYSTGSNVSTTGGSGSGFSINITSVRDKLINLNSFTGEAQFTLSKSSGTVDCDYLDISNSNATGGATWNAGEHSLDTTNNDGWVFNVTTTSTTSSSSTSSTSSSTSISTSTTSSSTSISTSTTSSSISTSTTSSSTSTTSTSISTSTTSTSSSISTSTTSSSISTSISTSTTSTSTSISTTSTSISTSTTSTSSSTSTSISTSTTSTSISTTSTSTTTTLPLTTTSTSTTSSSSTSTTSTSISTSTTSTSISTSTTSSSTSTSISTTSTSISTSTSLTTSSSSTSTTSTSSSSSSSTSITTSTTSSSTSTTSSSSSSSTSTSTTTVVGPLEFHVDRVEISPFNIAEGSMSFDVTSGTLRINIRDEE